MAPLPGDRVRCDYRAEHRGTVLAAEDPRCWAGSLAFPTATPDPEAVRAHVAYCKRQGWLDDRIPVLWDFGRVYWDSKLTVVGPGLKGVEYFTVTPCHTAE